MTIQEAIERLEVHKRWKFREGTMTALDMAISALKEIQQYREIGTVEECREAKEKQIPKVPDYEGDGYDNKGELIYDTWICPNCGKNYEVDYDDYKHCPECGQRLDIGG